jgi:carboxylesterase
VVPIKSLYNFLVFIKKVTIPNLAKVRAPTLIVHASEDPVVDPRSAQKLHECLGSNYKKVCWLNGRFHSLSNMQKREEIFDRIYKFIRELS